MLGRFILVVYTVCVFFVFFFLSSRRRHTICALGTGVQTCALPICQGMLPRHPIYLLVEKILAPHEHLCPEWPVDGTTGYEFMNQINGLFVDQSALGPLTETYERFIGRRTDFAEMVIEAKRQILRNNLSSELNVLTDLVYRIARQSLTTRDYTRQGVRDALIELISHFPVYRTYVTEDRVDDGDRHYLTWAVTQARRDSTADDLSIFDFVVALISTELKREPGRPYRRADVLHAAMKFQQLTGPVMAKAFEDTALYRFNRSEEHTSELQSLMRISYAVFCLQKKNNTIKHINQNSILTNT